MIDAILAAVLPLAAAASAPAAMAPAVPQSLIDRAGVVCFKITNRGNVADAFLPVVAPASALPVWRLTWVCPAR